MEWRCFFFLKRRPLLHVVNEFTLPTFMLWQQCQRIYLWLPKEKDYLWQLWILLTFEHQLGGSQKSIVSVNFLLGIDGGERCADWFSAAVSVLCFCHGGFGPCGEVAQPAPAARLGRGRGRRSWGRGRRWGGWWWQLKNVISLKNTIDLLP